VTPTIRRATLRDVDELARLRWESRLEHGTPATTSFDDFLERFGGFAPEGWLWLDVSGD